MITFVNNGINTSILDYDAREFIRVTKITDQTQIRAINDLCKELKEKNIWNSFFRCYPFVYTPGFTSSSLYCLKTRSILITGSGTTPNSFTVSSTGIEFGLTSSLEYDGTLVKQQNGELFYGGHISIYNRKATSSLMDHGHIWAGSSFPGQRKVGPIIAFNSGTGTVYGSIFNASTYNITGSPVNSINNDGFNGNPRSLSFTYSGSDTGLFIFSNSHIEPGTASMTNPFNFYMSKNETVLGVSYSVRNWIGGISGTGKTLKTRIGNLLNEANVSVLQSTQEICWYSIGIGDCSGVDGGPIDIATQRQDFYRIIQKFQTTLGRQV